MGRHLHIHLSKTRDSQGVDVLNSVRRDLMALANKCANVAAMKSEPPEVQQAAAEAERKIDALRQDLFRIG